MPVTHIWEEFIDDNGSLVSNGEISNFDIGRITCNAGTTTSVTKYFAYKIIGGKIKNVQVLFANTVLADIYPFSSADPVLEDKDITQAPYNIEFYADIVAVTADPITTAINTSLPIDLSPVDALDSVAYSQIIGVKVTVPITNASINDIEIHNLGIYVKYSPDIP
jgi:hypothetical protein